LKEDEEEYTKELESVIQKFLQPVKGIPFCVAIKALYDRKVIPIDQEKPEDIELLDDLEKVATIAGRDARRSGIFRGRPNEVGNDMEPFVKKALNSIGLTGETPSRVDGKRQSAGYPDIYFLDRNNRHVYLECKTYNEANIKTTQRAFYFSPSGVKESKVAHDAFHLVLSFEIEVDRARRKGSLNCYVPAGWMLVSIRSMEVDVKHEFNSSNKEMYKTRSILRRGRLDGVQSFF
jgi:hypothetical protein